MTRTFADLHLRINPKDQQLRNQVISKVAKFGYRYVSIPLNSGIEESEVSSIRDACLKAGLDFVLRLDYKPKTLEDMMRFLRKLRRRAEVICIICDNKEIARQAAKDRRVDLLNFPSLDYRNRFFDRAEAELASSSLAALEIDLKPLLVLSGPPRVRFLSSLRRETAIAKEFHVPIVLSSGITESSVMRTPRDLASLAYLFGMQEPDALNAVSIYPVSIILRNREKLGSKFVAPGIRVIKEGDPD